MLWEKARRPEVYGFGRRSRAGTRLALACSTQYFKFYSRLWVGGTKRVEGELPLTSSVARRGLRRADGVSISPTPPQDIAPGSVNSARCSHLVARIRLVQRIV
jgi:hypothetical protein